MERKDTEESKFFKGQQKKLWESLCVKQWVEERNQTLKMPGEERAEGEEEEIEEAVNQSWLSYITVEKNTSIAYIYRKSLYDSEIGNNIRIMSTTCEELFHEYFNFLVEEIEKHKDVTKQELLQIKFVPHIFESDCSEQIDVLKIFFDSDAYFGLAEDLNSFKSDLLDFYFEFDEEGKYKSNKQYDFDMIENHKTFSTLVKKGMAKAIAGKEIFKEEDEPWFIILPQLNDGRVYSPPHSNHTWLNNLSWLLAHIHKGNEFFIVCDVSEEFLTRKTKGKEKELTGFCREIALLSKLGYTISISDKGHIKIAPPSYLDPQKLTIKHLWMKNEEVEKIYLQTAEKVQASKADKKRESNTSQNEEILGRKKRKREGMSKVKKEKKSEGKKKNKRAQEESSSSEERKKFESDSQAQPLMKGSLKELFSNTGGTGEAGKSFSFGPFGLFDDKGGAEEATARETFVIQRQGINLQMSATNIREIEIKAGHKGILEKFITEISEKMGDQIKQHQFSSIVTGDGTYKVSINIPAGQTSTIYLEEIKKIIGDQPNKPLGFNN